MLAIGVEGVALVDQGVVDVPGLAGSGAAADDLVPRAGAGLPEADERGLEVCAAADSGAAGGDVDGGAGERHEVFERVPVEDRDDALVFTLAGDACDMDVEHGGAAGGGHALARA